MAIERWKPNATVAAVIEDRGRFLLVREETAAGIRYNQPAGHLEHGETIAEAVVREALEETGWRVEPQALLGIYQAESFDRAITYLRFAIICHPVEKIDGRALDDGILDTHWLEPQAIRALGAELRSPAVLACLDDYLAGLRYPLSLIRRLD